jgi:hemolysin activation/secretion protein
MNIKKLTTFIFALCITGTAFAAPQAPSIGDAIRQAEPPKDIPVQEQPLPKVEKQERPVMKSTGGKTVHVNSFSIAGNTAISTEELNAVANAPENVGRDMTFGDIQAVAAKLTEYYKERGYFVAKAYIPKQEMTDGKVELVILEGKYGELNIQNNSLVNDGRIRKMADKAADDEIILSGTLEHQMLLVNKTPGAHLKKLNIRPGVELGTSDFDFQVDAAPRVYGYLIGDNYGLRYTGEYRAMAGVGINSPLGLGDRLFLNGLMSDNGGLTNGRAAYLLPLNASGLTAELSYSHTEYELSEEYDYLDATGRSDNTSVEFKYPLHLSRNAELYTTVLFSYKDMEDEMEEFDTLVDKDTISVYADVSYKRSYTLFGLPSSTKVKGGLKVGRLDFDDSDSERADKAGADTAGTYSKLNVSVEQKTNFSRKFSLSASLQIQQALGNKNLDGSEDISLGGVYGVKVYPSGEESAENGYIMNAELFYRLPKVKEVTSMLSIFADHAYAKPQYDFSDENGRSLSDVGIGGYVYYKTFFMKAYYAHAVGGAKVESEPDYNNKLLVQAGMTF